MHGFYAIAPFNISDVKLLSCDLTAVTYHVVRLSCDLTHVIQLVRPLCLLSYECDIVFNNDVIYSSIHVCIYMYMLILNQDTSKSIATV